ncbi:MAG: hemolysin family protein [Acidimicrobiales bacterium]
MADIPLLAALVVLFLAAVFLAAAEASLLRVPRIRVEVLAEQGDHGAARLLRLLEDLPRVMNTVLLAVLLVQIGAATLSGVFAERHFGGIGITFTSIVLTIVLFVYAESIPKTYAVRQPLAVARFVARPVKGLTWLLRPLVSVLVRFADLQTPGEAVVGRVWVSEDELRRLAAEAADVGEIEPSDVELVEAAFDLGDATVAKVLVPRPDIVAVASERSMKDALDIALTSGHRRMPVYRGDLDNIIGFVRLRDLAAAVSKNQDGTVGDIAMTHLVVPENKQVFELLREMQAAGRHIAVAVDEHGGTAGIVTIEDLVAELVGQVADEGEPPVAEIRAAGDRLVVDAATDVDDLAERLGADLPTGNFHTVAGLVIDVAGRIPTVGDEIEISGHVFRVTEGTDRRVRTLEVN